MLINRFTVEHQGRPVSLERPRQPLDKSGNGRVLPRGNDRIAEFLAHRPLRADALPQPDDDLTGNLHHRLRMLLEEPLELFPREHHKLAVPDGRDRGGSGLIGQDGHLADDLTSPHLADGDLFARGLLRVHPEPSAQQNIKTVSRIAFAHERVSAREAHPAEPAREFTKERFIEPAENIRGGEQ